jgi:hypothetical protein
MLLETRQPGHLRESAIPLTDSRQPASVGNSQFLVDFGSDGSVYPFRAAPLWDEAGRQTIRRQLFPADPSVYPIDSAQHHPRSEFQVFDELTGNSQSGWNSGSRPIVAEQQWRAEEDSVAAVVQLHLREDEAARSVRVRWTLPFPFLPDPGIGSGASVWQVWTAHLNAPFSDYGHLVFTHGRTPDVASEIALPAVTLFHKEVDLGFTFFIDQEVPWMTRVELDQRQHLLVFEFSHVGLRPGNSAEIALRFFCHRGCWRDGLAAIQRRFPCATKPLSGNSRKYEGVMAYAIPTSEKAMGLWADKMGLRFSEILHFDNFGEYAPEEPWDCRNFWTESAPWRKIEGLTWARLREYVRACREQGIGAFLYINFTDCESNLAREKYSRAIVRNERGREIITYVYPDGRRHALMMNPDPQFGFGQAILEQAGRILERVPELDGFHFDQSAYGWIDTAHDDGQTMLDNQPAYNMLMGYRRIGKLFRKLCDEHGKLIEANGVINFRQLEDVDMLMAEQSLAALARYGPICSERGLFYLSSGEQGFQWALKYGAFPHVTPYEWAPQDDMALDPLAAAVYQAYLPINSLLRGATWVLEPNCLELPQQQRDENYLGNITGNFYRLADGDYLVTLLQAPQSVLNTMASTRKFTHWNNEGASVGLHREEIRPGFAITLRFADAPRVRAVALLQHDQPPVPVEWRCEGRELAISVPQLGAVGAVRLSVPSDLQDASQMSIPVRILNKKNGVDFAIK